MRLQFTKLHIVLELLSIATLAIFIIYVVATWASIPQTIPAHYNIAGEVDRYGSKSEMLFLPILTVAMFAGLTVLEFFPGIWNVTVNRSSKSYPAVLVATRSFLIGLKTVVVLTFASLYIFSAMQIGIPVYFVPVELGLIALLFVLYFRRVRKIKKMESMA